MLKEAESFNTPDTYAKYGKIQRQIVQKEKVLAIMVKEAQEERQKRLSEAPAKQENHQAAGGPGFINKTQLTLTGIYLLAFYIAPIYMIPRVYEFYETLIITQVKRP